MVSTSSIGNEAAAILQLLHSTNGQKFREDIEPWLTEEEERLIAAAESLGLYWQAVHIFQDVIRRLTLWWAELTGWPSHSLAEVVQPNKLITPTLRYVALDMPRSRNLFRDKLLLRFLIPKWLLPDYQNRLFWH